MRGTVVRRGAKWSVIIDEGRDLDGKRIRRWHSGFDRRGMPSGRESTCSAAGAGTYVATAS